MKEKSNNIWQIQVRKGLIEYSILFILSKKNLHGYGIVQEIRMLDGFEVTESAIYPILSRFHKVKMLALIKEPSEVGPPKSIYSITALGKTRLLIMRKFLKRINQSIYAMTNK